MQKNKHQIENSIAYVLSLGSFLWIFSFLVFLSKETIHAFTPLTMTMDCPQGYAAVSSGSVSGNADEVVLKKGVKKAKMSKGAPDGLSAFINGNDRLVLDLTDEVPEGEQIKLWLAAFFNGPIHVTVSTDNMNWSDVTTFDVAGGAITDYDYTVPQNISARYISFEVSDGADLDLDAVTYQFTNATCMIDTDLDGIADVNDDDDDNDGELDEAEVYADCSEIDAMKFENPQTEPGGGFRFSNVKSGLDAVVKVVNNNNTTIDVFDVDFNNPGNFYMEVFPIVEGDFYVDVSVTFVESGTTTPVIQENIITTAIDIDGDNYATREQVGFKDHSILAYEDPSFLTLSEEDGYQVLTGPVTSLLGITTTVREIMTSAVHLSKSSVQMRFGAKDAEAGSNRWYSISFDPCDADNYINPILKGGEYLFPKDANRNGIADHLDEEANSLPVELSYFKGRAESCNNKLTWRSESEDVFSHYELERSSDGRRFERIETIEGQGGMELSQTYRYSDTEARGKNYYRLHMVDLDGSSEYSPVIVIESDCDGNEEMKIYPNPLSVRQGVLNVSFFSKETETELLVFSADGKEMRRVSISVEKEMSNTVRLDINGLQKGVYFLRRSGEEQAITFVLSE